MAEILILQTIPVPPIIVDSDDLVLHGSYSQRYLDSDGVTVVMPGPQFGYRTLCTRDGDNQLVIPEFTIRTTNGIDNVSSRFIGQLYVDGVPDVIIFGFSTGTGWMIPETLGASTTWDQLDVYNAGQVQYPFGVPTTLADWAIIALIQSIPKGDSGYSGFSGISGFSGVSGFTGMSGFTGASGTSGFTGVSGAIGISGFSGASGKSGFTGASGISGFSGASGASGKSGFSGVSGAGSSGASGASGASGKSGFSGASGA